MSPPTQGRKIAVIGLGGQVGTPTVKGLLAQGIHTITAVQRLESTSTFPHEVVVKTGDLNDESFLVIAFQGQDAVVLMPPIPHIISVQEPAVRAAAKAGVPYVLPSEFGPDPFASRLIEENELLQNKKRIRDLIEELGATIWTGATGKVNASSVAHSGYATAAVLSLPEEDLSRYRNKAFYVPSCHLTQKELLEAVQKETGTTESDWEVKHQEIKDALKDCNAKIQQGDGVAPFAKFFLTHFQEGNGGDFQHKVVVDDVEKLHKIGLRDETIESVLRSCL
ncbi:NAD(P)-binding domain-containing protein [Fusarium heterosporum]|uniref:NAD(P)-binding domain-containing protein n=1 Tax=Fusarium heterosporum TaxID=42747 RepID=A0A8H5WTX5_FUSHE|nr:NAD(P)-binding domain-containing protein [Fusarium heterosporum]